MTDYKCIKSPLGHYSATPMPTPEELEKYYSEEYYQKTPSVTYQNEYSDEEVSHKKLRANLLLFAARKLAKKAGTFLEVGCGEGFILKAAENSGFEVTGIDYSIHGIRSFHPELEPMIEIGDATQLLLGKATADFRADVCVLQNVVEHVIDPATLLRNIKEVMKKYGIVIVNIPNDCSSMQNDIKTRGHVEEDYWFGPPAHLHYFNSENINVFMESLDFEVLDTYADFPIEFFLYHPGSNYVNDRANGSAAHSARLAIDLLLAENGIENYHQLCQAMTACGIGRNVSVIARCK